MPQTNKTPQFETLLQLASSQRELGQWHNAHKNLKQILKQAPDHLLANMALVQLYLDQKKTSKARALLLKIQKNKQPPLEALLLWAKEFGKKDHENTLQQLEKALLSHPTHSELLVQAASYLIDDKQEERALTYLKQLIQKLIMSGETWLTIANLLLQIGELSLAAEAFAKAAKLEPELQHNPRWLDIEADWKRMTDDIRDSELIQITDKLQSEG